MKIVHVELGRHLYGGQRQVAYLMDALPGLGGEHVLVCAEGSDIAGLSGCVPAKILPLAFGGDVDLGFVARLRRELRAEQPDLLHIHSRRGDTLATLAGSLAKIPMVYSRRVDNPPNWLDRRYKFPRYAQVITISEGIRQVLLGVGLPADQVICAPSAVDTAVYREERARAVLEQEFGIGPDVPVIGMVAQLIPRKGHDVLLKALPAILEVQPDCQVLIFGKGPLEAELRQRIEQSRLARSARLVGFRSDMPRWLPNLDLVVHPAYMEGLGVALLEAAACGVPMVGTRAGGIPGIVRDGLNGRLIDAGDSRGLADAVIDLLGDPDRLRAWGQAGRELVEGSFSIGAMARNNLAVYEAVLSRG